MKINCKEELTFWKTAITKSIVTAGITFFSLWVTLGIANTWKPVAVAAGTYLFAEAAKYYKIQPDKKVNGGTYKFIL